MEKVYGAAAFCGTLFLVPMPCVGSVRGVSRSGVWRCVPAFIFQKGSVYSFSLKLKILPNHCSVLNKLTLSQSQRSKNLCLITMNQRKYCYYISM